MIGGLNAPINQQVLDEWTGIITAGAIRSSTLGCLRALRVGKLSLTRRSIDGIYLYVTR